MNTAERDEFGRVFGNKLQKAIYDGGLNVSDIAKLLGVAPSKAMRKLEGESTFLKPSETFEICKQVGADIGKLMHEAWEEVLANKG